MVASIEDIARQIAELNDLVRGATMQSGEAVEELRSVVDGHGSQLAAMEQLRADVDALATDVRKGNKQILDRTFAGGRSSYRGHFESAAQSRAFGLMILGHILGRKSALDKLAADGVEVTRAMGEGTDTGGGFLAPEEFLAVYIRLVEMYGVFRRNARYLPMGRDRTTVAKRASGLTVYCPGEGATITASDITVGLIGATAKAWHTLTLISTELEEDAAIAIAELVIEEISLALASKEDSCGFIGDGTSTYFGITGVLNHASTTNQAGASGADTFAEACAWTYLAGCIGKLNTWALIDARYYFHRSVFWSNVVGQVDSNGVPIVKFVTSGGEGRGAPLQLGGATPLLLGFPVELVDCLPATSADAVSTAFWAFGSLRQSWILAQRGTLEIAESREFKFDTSQVAIRGTERVDIIARAAEGMCKTTTAGS